MMLVKLVGAHRRRVDHWVSAAIAASNEVPAAALLPPIVALPETRTCVEHAP